MKTNFSALVAKAEAAGAAAAAACVPVGMVVSEADVMSGAPLPGGRSWYVADGVCGFAWISVRPANSSFGLWAKKAGIAKPAYGGGLQIWVSGYGQSMQKKEAYAEAYAKVLSEAGIKAYAGSRMD
jgi:hypothetical protein